MPSIKTAVIGYGLSATVFHLPFIVYDDAYDLVAISTSRGEQAGSEWPDIDCYPSGEELIQKADADLVIVTAPNTVHFDLARAALRAGRHVVIEKPMVNTVAEAEALLSLSREARRLLVPFHNRRWDGDFLTVKKLIQSGRLGEVRHFESHFDRFRPRVRDRWRERPGPGSGAWFDLGPHLVDQAICLFGPPLAVTARCLALREHSQATDNFHVLLHYPACEVVLHGSSFAAGPNIRFQVQGTGGSFVKYGLDPQEERLKAGACPHPPQWAQEAETAFGTLYTGTTKEIVPTELGGYQAFYSQLADIMAQGIKDGTDAPVAVEDALAGIALIQLAEESDRQGRTLPFDTAE